MMSKQNLLNCMAALMVVLATAWATRWFSDWSFSVPRHHFTQERAFSDFFNSKISQLAKDHYEPVTLPRRDSPYVALCFQALAPFPDTSAGAVAFVSVSATLYLLGIALFARVRNVPLTAALIFTAFSGTFILSLERANPIMLAAAAVCVFFAWYDAPTPGKRTVAAIALAFAAAWKVSPVLLGTVYLTNWRRPKEWMWREIFISGTLAVLLTFVPFFLFDYGGVAGIQKWIENAGQNSAYYALMGGYGFPKIMSWFSDFFMNIGHPLPFVGMAATRLPSACVGVAAFMLSFFVHPMDRRLFLLVLSLCMIPGNTFFYCNLYLIPVALIFTRTVFDMILFALCLAFVPISIANMSVYDLMLPCFLLILFARLTFTMRSKCSTNLREYK